MTRYIGGVPIAEPEEVDNRNASDWQMTVRNSQGNVSNPEYLVRLEFFLKPRRLLR